MVSADGYILIDGRPVRGHAVCEDGRTEFCEGPLGRTPDLTGIIVPHLTDTHTHCADAGVRPVPGMTLEELVAPPDGLKHRYLRSAPRERLIEDIRGFWNSAAGNGISAFIDFREGGADGCRLAREAETGGILLGRPMSQQYDQEEMDELLSVADGVAVSSLSDMDYGYIEKVADAAHRAGKPFAIHCSERVREDLEKVLALDPAFLVHMVEATDSDLRMCADLDIPISVCPRSNRFFGKVPPLGRMMEHGCTVGIGTDNAMLCSPDLRPEAELFREILGDGRDRLDWTWRCLTEGSSKILYRTRMMCTRSRTESGFTVLPVPGGEPESAWTSGEKVHSV